MRASFLRPLARALALGAALLLIGAAHAQDGLNLPADLFVLTNDGRVQRYGVGASGVAAVLPEDTYVVDFGLDATGTRLAYRSDAGAFLLDVSAAGAVPLQLEGTSADVPPFRGQGDTIAWAPGGDAIAFTTTYGLRAFFIGANVFAEMRDTPFRQIMWSPGGRFLAGETVIEAGSVWFIYRREGATLALASLISGAVGGVAWLSDSEVVFAPQDGGLRLMQLDQANTQVTLLEPPLIYALPALDADSALVAFARDPADAAVPNGYGTLLRLERGAAQTQTVGAVPVALANLAWSPRAELLVLLQGGVMALFNPATGGGFPLPINGVAAYDWGASTAQSAPSVATTAPVAATPEPAAAPTTASTVTPPVVSAPLPVETANGLLLTLDGYFLAPVPGPDGAPVTRVWRLPADGSRPAIVTRNTTNTVEYAVSAQGVVAYVVEAELWAQVADEAPFRLARLNSFAPAQPAFSRDGTTVFYTDEGSGIWRITLEGARTGEDPELLRARGLAADGTVTQALRRPQPSPDGTKLLIDVYGPAQVANDALDLASREVAAGAPFALDDLRPDRAVWLSDGRAVTVVDALSAAAAPPGLYLISPPNFDGGALVVPLPVDDEVRALAEPMPGVLRLILADGSGAEANLRVADAFLSGDRAGTLSEVLTLGPMRAPRITGNGRFIGGMLANPDGATTLAVIDALTGGRFAISNTADALDFQWAPSG